MGVFVRVKKYGDRNVIDLSEWGRPFARVIARFLKEKPISVIQVTTLHLLLTIFCSWLILEGNYVMYERVFVCFGINRRCSTNRQSRSVGHERRAGER